MIVRAKTGYCPRQIYTNSGTYGLNCCNQALTRFENRLGRSTSVTAMFRPSLIYASWETSVNFHPVKRFKCHLLRAVQGKPIIERCFVLPLCVGVSKLPCLHVLDCCVLQQRMAGDYLNVRRFTRTGGPAPDPADTENAVGAPSFAHSAKGGNHERMRNGVLCRETRVVSATSQPALANNARACPERSRRDAAPGRVAQPLIRLTLKTQWVPRPLRTPQRAGTTNACATGSCAERQALCWRHRSPPLQTTQEPALSGAEGTRHPLCW